MKFISVILAFFAVVVMVQAAPLAKRGGPVGPGLSELVAIAEGILRKYGITKRDVEVPATVDTIKNDVTNIVGLSKDNFVDAIIIAVQADVSLSVDVHVDIKVDTVKAAVNTAIDQVLGDVDTKVNEILGHAANVDVTAPEILNLVYVELAQVVVVAVDIAFGVQVAANLGLTKVTDANVHRIVVEVLRKFIADYNGLI